MGASRASQFFITTEDAEDTENGHFMGNYGVFSVSSASSVVKNFTNRLSSLPKTLRRSVYGGKRRFYMK
jgi:hypothetical protein